MLEAKTPLYLKLILGMALVLAGGISWGGAWLAGKLILDPESVVWINRFLPKGTQFSIAVENPPQTLVEIRQQLQQENLSGGEPITVATEMLLPITQYQSRCDCDTIVTLQVYKSVNRPQQEQRYHLLQEVEVAPIEEFFAVAPLVNQDPDAPFSSNELLPLTQLEILPKTTAPGIWINLSGTQPQGDKKITYGHIFHYNPRTTYLGSLLTWTSPAGKPPQWQEVTNGEPPELVVDQTVGFEPQLQVYRLQERQFAPDPTDLKAIDLHKLKFSVAQAEYNRALFLSRQGLWSPALTQLEVLKRQFYEAWDISHQEQLDLITLHARRTQAQCQKPWASPSQQILACIIDGNWQASLTVFQAANDEVIAGEITALLKNDQGRIKQRLETALETENTAAVVAWGALQTAMTQGYSEARQWLKKLSLVSPQTEAEVLAVLEQWQFALAQTSPQDLHLSRILGVARPVTTLSAQNWLRPEADEPLPTLQPQQRWYVVEIQAFNDGRQWQSAPFDLPTPHYAPGKQLWRKLGLNLDPWLQLVSFSDQGSQSSLLGRVQGVQIVNNNLKLLVSSQALSPGTAPVLFTYSKAALDWRKTGATTLSSLQQLQPQLTAKLLPSLWQAIQHNSAADFPANPTELEILAEIGHWLVNPTDLTGNEKPEIIVKVYKDGDQLRQLTFGESEIGQPKTLMFTDTGQLIYDELSQEQEEQLVGIADIEKQQLPSLVVKAGDTYKLKRWSARQKEFHE